MTDAEPPRWTRIYNKAELEAFYRSILPALRTVARECGYAIGLHGSMQRDLDLIAVPWTDDHSDRDALAHALMKAACGMTMERFYWEDKPCGRVAVSFPVCWTEKSETFKREASLGHIDLSIMPPLHVCGLTGYDPMQDAPCPGCLARNTPKVATPAVRDAP